MIWIHLEKSKKIGNLLTSCHHLEKWIFPVNSPSLQWRHNDRNGVQNHQPHDWLLNRLFRHRLKKTPKLRVTGLCEGNSPGTGEFPAQRASNAENASIWWRHHDCFFLVVSVFWGLPPLTERRSSETSVTKFSDSCNASSISFQWCNVHHNTTKVNIARLSL